MHNKKQQSIVFLRYFTTQYTSQNKKLLGLLVITKKRLETEQVL